MCIRDRYNMVRIIAGTLVKIGGSDMPADAMKGIIAATAVSYTHLLEKGRTFYTSNAGLKELKVEIARYLDRRYGMTRCV